VNEVNSALRAARRYVEHYRKVLGLEQWKIEVEWAPGLEDHINAMIWHTYQRYVAVVSVGWRFVSLTPSERAEAIFHEVLHSSHFLVFDTLRTALPATPFARIEALFVNQLEYMVDGLTTALFRQLPLPKGVEL
jgi:hypothetical protein